MNIIETLRRRIHNLRLRVLALEEGGAASSTDHGTLSGLTDDDHTAYHNDTRGDARYLKLTNYIPTMGVTFTIAASDASANVKANADYICDGTADEVQIKAAIAAARTAGGGEVRLSEGTFYIDNQLAIAYSAADNGQPVKIAGTGSSTILDITALDLANGAVLFYGTATATTTTLTANGDTGDQVIAVTSAASFSAGDYIRISSTTSHGANTKGEIFKIESISTNDITLDGFLNDDYTTAATGLIYEVIMVNNLEVSNMKFLGDVGNTSACGLRVSYGDNISFHDLEFKDVKYAAMRCGNMINSEVYSNRITGTNQAGLGYATVLSYACKLNSIHHNIASNCVKLCTVSGGGGIGVTFFTHVHDNLGFDLLQGIETHGEGKHTLIENNIISGCYGHAFSASDDFVSIINNKVFNHYNDGSSSDAGIHIGGTQTTTVEVRGNKLYWNPAAADTTQAWGIRTDYNATSLVNIIIDNNYIDGYKLGVKVYRAIESLSIQNNTIVNPIAGGHGIYYDNNTSDSKNFIISGNTIDGDGAIVTGIQIESRNDTDLTNLSICGNILRNCTTNGLYLYTTDSDANAITGLIVKNNFIYDDQGGATQDNGININGRINNARFSQNYFSGNTTAAYTYTAGQLTDVIWFDNIGYATDSQYGDYVNGNYTQIASDGQITLVGDARVQKYIFFDPTNLTKIAGGDPPTAGNEGTFATLLFASNKTEEVWFNIHVPVDWAEDTDLELAIYWAPTDANSGGVAWEFEWEARQKHLMRL